MTLPTLRSHSYLYVYSPISPPLMPHVCECPSHLHGLYSPSYAKIFLLILLIVLLLLLFTFTRSLLSLKKNSVYSLSHKNIPLRTQCFIGGWHLLPRACAQLLLKLKGELLRSVDKDWVACLSVVGSGVYRVSYACPPPNEYQSPLNKISFVSSSSPLK